MKLYADYNDDNADKIGVLQQEFEEMDGWNAESSAAALLSNLDIKEDFHFKEMNELDGAQSVEIIRCLMQNPKLLIMDEPTSVLTPHMDRKLYC